MTLSVTTNHSLGGTQPIARSSRNSQAASKHSKHKHLIWSVCCWSMRPWCSKITGRCEKKRKKLPLTRLSFSWQLICFSEQRFWKWEVHIKLVYLKKLNCVRLSLSKPVIALSSSAKVIFFYLSAMTPNNLGKAGSHIRREIKQSVFRKKTRVA